MSNETLVVFTFKSTNQILEEGGSSAWRLDRSHARACQYAVCTRNAHSDRTEGREPHHTAFLIGKVKDVVPKRGREGRYIVLFSEYAELNIPDAWKGGRNPVSYSSLAELGIDPLELDWKSMPAPSEPEPGVATDRLNNTDIKPLTMAEAKQGLAAAYGVSPESIEITIRG